MHTRTLRPTASLDCVIRISCIQTLVVYDTRYSIKRKIIMANTRNIFKSIQLPGSSPGDSNWETARWGFKDWDSLFDNCFGELNSQERGVNVNSNDNQEQSGVNVSSNGSDTAIDINCDSHSALHDSTTHKCEQLKDSDDQMVLAALENLELQI